jgi:hypothetical protein
MQRGLGLWLTPCRSCKLPRQPPIAPFIRSWLRVYAYLTGTEPSVRHSQAHIPIIPFLGTWVHPPHS